jgi:hypothetical protein
MNKRVLLFSILLVICIKNYCQKLVTNSNQQWLQYFNQTVVSKKTTLFSDFGLRTTNSCKQISIINIRTGLGYSITKKLDGVSGLGLFASISNKSISRMEYRPYQDFNIKNKLGSFLIGQRLRLETRFFNQIAANTDPDIVSFNIRGRYKIGFEVPVIQLSQKNKEKKVLLNFGNEILLNVGKQINYNNFDSDRLSFGSTIQFSKNLNCALIYMYQYVERNLTSTYEHIDVINLTITQKIGFKK